MLNTKQSIKWVIYVMINSADTLNVRTLYPAFRYKWTEGFKKTPFNTTSNMPHITRILDLNSMSDDETISLLLIQHIAPNVPSNKIFIHLKDLCYIS